MDAEALFLERCKLIEEVSTPPYSEIRLLDMAGWLRLLLLDGTPLVHKVNRKYGLKLKFRVGCFRPAAVDEHITFVHLGDGLDPAVAALGKPIKVVNFEGFLGHKVMIFNGGKASRTVSDVILHGAEVAGGVHHTENPQGVKKLLADYSAALGLGGHPAGVQQLPSIGRVTLKGLGPLLAAVQKDRGT